MKLVIVLTLFIAKCQAQNITGANNHADEAHECMTIFFPLTQTCCLKEMEIKSFYKDNLETCKHLPSISPACDFDLCIATKKGFVFDGIIDNHGLEVLLQNYYESNTEFTKKLLSKCVNGDLSVYGTAKVCTLTKLRRCIESHSLAECPEWKTDGVCEGINDLVEKCINLDLKSKVSESSNVTENSNDSQGT